MRRFGGWLAGLALLGCGGDAPPAIDASSKRTLGSGEVVGFASGDAHAWRGLPFARPPVGELRWRPPQPPRAWEGVREALEFGAECPQLNAGGEAIGDEDCLFLNVFAPRFASEELPGAGERLPVMVWIHGGGNSMGSAEVYDGSRLAAEDQVVVVTVQYRLGVLGWFSHPALREDGASPDEASGNWATLDLVRALEWVRDEIAHFGGDPQRVTIFGESAGGMNVQSLLLSPRAQGLFHRAISQSGFPTTFTLAQAENRTDDPEPGEPGSSAEVLLKLLQQDGRAADREAAKTVADAMSPEEARRTLRGKTAAELLSTFNAGTGGASGGIYVAPFILRDGHVIRDESSLAVFERGAHNRVPSILGTNRDEHKLFMAFLSPHVTRAASIPLWLNDAERYDLVTEYGGLMWKALGADEPAAAMRRSQGPTVWSYRFDWDEQDRLLWLDLPRLIGAGHAMEILFVFGGTRSEMARTWFLDDPPSADALSEQMRSYWTHFAATGDPARGRGGDLPTWLPWSPEPDAPHTLILDSARDGGVRMSPEALDRATLLARVRGDPRLADPATRCEVYRVFVQWSDLIHPEDYPAVENGLCQPYPLTARTLFEER